jgi:hypothetical protein
MAKKKKISSEDFLHLMDDQESRSEKAAFQPPKSARRARRKKRTFSPVQKELIDFAISLSPKFIIDSTKRAQKIFQKVEKIIRG